jgi:hypothetical protein
MSPGKVTEVADGLYKLGYKRASIYWSIWIILASLIWSLSLIDGLKHYHTFIYAIAVLPLIFAVPLLFYGSFGYIWYNFPKTFYSIFSVAGGYFCYNFWLTIFENTKKSAGGYWVYFILFIILEMVIIAKLIGLFLKKTTMPHN